MISHTASLIGGDPEKLKTALKILIDDDVPVPVCVVPEAYQIGRASCRERV